MTDTTTTFRVVYSPTNCAYAASDDGEALLWYGTYKQACRAHGDRPLTIVAADDMPKPKDACGRWPGCRCVASCDYWSRGRADALA